MKRNVARILPKGEIWPFFLLASCFLWWGIANTMTDPLVSVFVGISACMSLMFPTIFGLGSRGLGEDTKLGGSGLIMAILGGAIITPTQAYVIDIANVSISYLVPMFCFVVIAAYGIFAGRAALPNRSVQVVME